MHVLFVCGRNRMRSPTAERMYRDDARIQARSAGTGGSSPHQISIADVEWADLILVMEEEYRAWIKQNFRAMRLPPIKCLDIPDVYRYMDAKLVELIRESVEPLIKTR